MKEQVFDLFLKQYPEQINTFPRFFENLYESQIYKNDSIRVVALIDKTVIGFQSFFKWPYFYKGKEFNSFQSGNSIVSPDHRGKGIFQKLLSHIYEIASNQNVDFLIGFPVSLSLPSFKKNGWTHLFDLQWHMKLIHPLPLLKKQDFRNKNISKVIPHGIENNLSPESFSLSNRIDWLSWKASLSPSTKFYYEAPNGTLFQLKINRRLYYFNEVIIGDIRLKDLSKINEDMKSLVNIVRKEMNCNFLSFAHNERSSLNNNLDLKSMGFKKINKQIHFIVKPISNSIDEIMDAGNWQIFRGDLDTW
ncbi:GNAT family N-acetyltransferase [Cytophagales bacterium SYC-11]